MRIKRKLSILNAIARLSLGHHIVSLGHHIASQRRWAFSPASLVTALLCGCLASCGGGGGGSDFIGAAVVSVQTTPSTIDTGDRMLVTSELFEVHENGILLKYRFPSGLEYVLDSASLVVAGNDDETAIDPSVNSQEDGQTYVVFFLRASQFGDEGRGTVSLQLKGVDRVVSGTVEVDADVNDPLIDDGAEFEVADPEFEAEDSTGVAVEG